MNQHPTTEQILGFLDQRPDDTGLARHIESCAECAALVGEFRRIDAAGRRLPVLTSPSGITGRVMARVLSPEADSLSYRLLKGLGYLIPMSIVLLVLGMVFSKTGVIDPGGGNGAGDRIQEVMTAVGVLSGSVSEAIIGLLRSYAPFMANNEAAGIILAIIVTLSGCLFLDRVLAGRFGTKMR